MTYGQRLREVRDVLYASLKQEKEILEDFKARGVTGIPMIRQEKIIKELEAEILELER